MVHNKEIIAALALGLMIGCAQQRNIIRENSAAAQITYPCDSLVNSFPECAREYVKDGCYYIGDKRIYKIKNSCYEATRDTIEKSCCEKTIKREYWK